MKRVPTSVRLKEEIEGMLHGQELSSVPAEPPMVGFVGRLARYMLQVAIEAEATAFLGRAHYRRGVQQPGAVGPPHREGARDGNQEPVLLGRLRRHRQVRRAVGSTDEDDPRGSRLTFSS